MLKVNNDKGKATYYMYNYFVTHALMRLWCPSQYQYQNGNETYRFYSERTESNSSDSSPRSDSLRTLMIVPHVLG